VINLKPRQNREVIQHNGIRFICRRCWQPDFTCYCEHLQRFDPKIRFVILIHPLEARKRIATGRMTHLTLENSLLIEGHEYTNNDKVNSIIEDPKNHVVILYPGRNSTNLSSLDIETRSQLFPEDKELVIFVIDGTWNTARKTMHLSLNFKNLPRICFSPPYPSRFRIRKQPASECFSTIEAVHHTIELLGPSRGFNVSDRTHHSLLNVFDKMVEQRLEFMEKAAAL
jgi:DTW domain-containing protein